MKPLAPVQTSPPAVTPVSVDEAKARLRIDSTDEDSTVGLMITAATAYLDGWSGTLGRALVTQTWAQSFSDFPVGRRLRLPLAPVQSISSITYQDADDVEQTFDASNYRLQTDALGPYVELKRGSSWPGTINRDDAVTVTFVAGYGDNAADVPGSIRDAMILMIGHLFENREATSPLTIKEIPWGAKTLLAPFNRIGP